MKGAIRYKAEETLPHLEKGTDPHQHGYLDIEEVRPCLCIQPQFYVLLALSQHDSSLSGLSSLHPAVIF